MSLQQVDAYKVNAHTTVKVAMSSEGAIIKNTKDAYSNTRLIECDRDGDGKIDSASLFYEDGEGRTIKGEYDIDADGKIDSTSLFDYYDDGNLKTRYDDVDGDLKFDYYTEFSYDEDGNRIESEPQELTGWNGLAKGKKSIDITRNAQTMHDLQETREKRKNATEAHIEQDKIDLD